MHSLSTSYATKEKDLNFVYIGFKNEDRDAKVFEWEHSLFYGMFD